MKHTDTRTNANLPEVPHWESSAWQREGKWQFHGQFHKQPQAGFRSSLAGSTASSAVPWPVPRPVPQFLRGGFCGQFRSSLAADTKANSAVPWLPAGCSMYPRKMPT